MKKTALLLAICIILATFLTACGGNYDAQISSLEEQLSKLQQESDAQKEKITDLEKENSELQNQIDAPRYDWDNPIIIDWEEYLTILIKIVYYNDAEAWDVYMNTYCNRLIQISGYCYRVATRTATNTISVSLYDESMAPISITVNEQQYDFTMNVTMTKLMSMSLSQFKDKYLDKKITIIGIPSGLEAFFTESIFIWGIAVIEND